MHIMASHYELRVDLVVLLSKMPRRSRYKNRDAFDERRCLRPCELEMPLE
ncbi:WRKY domain-containing protein [Psidium guajava]|nr:WRKY domain-containing protein [Psidium guajava]